MHFQTMIAISLPVLGALAAPQSAYAASTATQSCSAPQSTPSKAYSLISARSASAVHLLPWTASGKRFWLGGQTSSYCPDSVNQTGGCPPGNYTAFLGTCGMDTVVPGGQQIYVTPSGEIGFTQAHSAALPTGANPCPFLYNKPAGSQFGYISLDPKVAFGASGFMGCPTDSGRYQVFANTANATVPQGDASKCLSFNALASDFDGYAAWQYE